MIKFILYIWQLPQNLIGLLILLFYKILGRILDSGSYEDAWTYVINHLGGSGLSLGYYIFLSKLHTETDVVKHEYGHVMQSKILGPFYLFVIAIPSGLSTLFNFKDSSEFYTEVWADKLGGLK